MNAGAGVLPAGLSCHNFTMKKTIKIPIPANFARSGLIGWASPDLFEEGF
jgi:hypothetical protein